MTNYAEDICRIIHMAKVFPCLFPMGKTNNDNYTRNNDKITLFISLIHELQIIKQTSSLKHASNGFGAQLIGPIKLHVKRQNSRICKFFHCLDFFLPVSGKICHSPIKKMKRQPTLIISFSQHSPFFGEQSKNPG